MTASTASRGSMVNSWSSMADSAPGRSGTSTSARKPSLPRFTPSTGARCRSASRIARSIVPSPPRLTSRSERWPSSAAVTAIAAQFSLLISASMPRTWAPCARPSPGRRPPPRRSHAADAGPGRWCASSVKVPGWHSRSQVEHQVATRLGAADQRVSRRRDLDRVGRVADRPRTPGRSRRCGTRRCGTTSAPARRRLRPARAGWRSRWPQRTVRPLRANATCGPSPGAPGRRVRRPGGRGRDPGRQRRARRRRSRCGSAPPMPRLGQGGGHRPP